jgi:hypothetical protein
MTTVGCNLPIGQKFVSDPGSIRVVVVLEITPVLVTNSNVSASIQLSTLFHLTSMTVISSVKIGGKEVPRRLLDVSLSALTHLIMHQPVSLANEFTTYGERISVFVLRGRVRSRETKYCCFVIGRLRLTHVHAECGMMTELQFICSFFCLSFGSLDCQLHRSIACLHRFARINRFFPQIYKVSKIIR